VESYYELTNVDEIIHLILNLFHFKKSCKTIEDLIDQFELKSYARINSIRKSYLIDVSIRIDLDETVLKTFYIFKKDFKSSL
jgi:hypothetical protein